jgi:hypothetical protein
MRRKNACLLQTGEANVARLEAEHDQYLAHLNEGWQKFNELKTENELLKRELQLLLDLHVCYLPLVLINSRCLSNYFLSHVLDGWITREL